jgi:predicted ATP-dependent protease
VPTDSLRWICPRAWLSNPVYPTPGAALLHLQSRLRQGLEAQLRFHLAGRPHHLEISTDRSRSWGEDIAAFMRSKAPATCPVRSIAAPHHHELRGSAEEPGLLANTHGGIIVLDVGALSRPSWLACAEVLLTGHSRGRDSDDLPAGPSRQATLSFLLVGPELELRKFRDRHPEAARLFARRLVTEPDLPRERESVAQIAGLLLDGAQNLGLKGIGLPALAHLIEEASGRRSRRGRITTQLDELTEAIGEAGIGRNTKLAKPALITALASIRSRRDGLESYARDRVVEELLAIECEGAARGVVNGLMIYGSARQAYCMPGRISARISAGREGIINIEREAKYSGSSFDKGVFQLAAWLRGQFGHRKSLSFAATLTFEQSTSKVDGNSATLAESLAVLSALSSVPANQGIAVSGALSQRGQVLPIGSVNLKVEGWWKTCKAKGITGRQGVLIPSRNIGDLQLPTEIVDDLEDGRFHLWAADTIDDAVEVVLGKSPGKRLKRGGWTKDSVYQRSALHLALLNPSQKKTTTRQKTSEKDDGKKGKKPQSS